MTRSRRSSMRCSVGTVAPPSAGRPARSACGLVRLAEAEEMCIYTGTGNSTHLERCSGTLPALTHFFHYLHEAGCLVLFFSAARPTPAQFHRIAK